MEYVDSAVIHNNYLEDKQVYNYCYGSYLRYSNFLEFSSNNIRIIDAIAPMKLREGELTTCSFIFFLISFLS